MQIRQVLVAVVRLQPRRWKLLRQLGQLLLLQRGIRFNLRPRRDLVLRVPPVRPDRPDSSRPLLMTFPMPQQKKKMTPTDRKSAPRNTDDVVGVRVRYFVTLAYRRLVEVRLGIRVLAALSALRFMHGHGHAPKSPPDADRWWQSAAAFPVAGSSRPARSRTERPARQRTPECRS